MINNIFDQNIDAVSNPGRPLITKKVDLELYIKIAYGLLGCSLVCALVVGRVSFFIISGAILGYYSYSAPPLRLKRIPVLSKAIISLISLAIVFLGYITVQGESSGVGFPKFFVWFFLIGITLAANFIDLKDYAGDAAGRIMTVPVLLGLPLARLVIGISFMLAGVGLYFYFPSFYLFPVFLVAGILGFYFIHQKDYAEWRVFSLYLASYGGFYFIALDEEAMRLDQGFLSRSSTLWLFYEEVLLVGLGIAALILRVLHCSGLISQDLLSNFILATTSLLLIRACPISPFFGGNLTS